MTEPERRILLIGVDGIGLADLKNYQLKNFQSVVRNGASGKLKCSPALSVATAWTSLASGCSADRHGISSTSTVDQESGKIRAAGPGDWNRMPFWEILDQQELLTHRFNLPARHPEKEQDHCLSISPIFFNQIKCSQLSPLRSVQPASFFDAAKSLAISPNQVDRATLELFIPEIGNTAHRPEVGTIAGIIAANLSIQALAGRAMAELDWNLFMIRFSMADEINRLLASADESDATFVNVREAAFRTLNLCLGSFRRLAGEYTLVLYSTHGNGGGFVAFEGPDIKANEKLPGPRPEDIAPTLLNLFGLSAPDTMNGRVLEELFVQSPQTESCSAVPDLGNPALPSPVESGWLLEATELNTAAWRVNVMNNQQKAVAYLSRGQWFESLPYLIEQHVESPFSLEYALSLCQALFHSGLIAESAELMGSTAQLHPNAPISSLLQALSTYHSGHPEDAGKYMADVDKELPLHPDWRHLLAELYLHLNFLEMALQELTKLLDEHPDHTLALISKSELLTTQGLAAKATHTARRAVETDFSSERAHLALSRALLLQGQKEKARTAVVTALRLNPKSPAALDALAACIEEEEPWGAEMMRARSAASNPERQVESRRWQYRLFLQDAQRKMQLGRVRLMYAKEAAAFIQQHPLPLGCLEETEGIFLNDEQMALLRKPLLANEPARVEFIGTPSEELLQGVQERCRKLGIQKLRTWSLQQARSPLFQQLEKYGFKHWIQINQYQINGASAFAQMKPLVDRIPLPENSTIVPLNHISWEAVRLFIARHIPVTDDLLGPDGYHHISAELSAVALQNNQIAGVFINRIKGDVVHCPYLAVDPKRRNRWVVPHLFKTVAIAGTERGYAEMEFMTHPQHFPAMHAMLQRLQPREPMEFQGLEITVA